MSLSSGVRLGPYEIVAPLGAGGMGEVYRAKDTRLDRTVAIKVLPSHLSENAEVRQRFEREAKTISQLSHPHICALYDVGREGETEYLVMEYLEGETLSERLAKSTLPLEQTLRYGIEIADALDKAHRQGIVHRDLKPGNVMLTKSGVKLLDFGLAKAFERPLDAAGREQAAAAQHPLAKRSLTALSTVMGGPNLTQEGTILGTFQYMAPEQLEGKEADVRTDIFAFGAALYEMATGKKAFSGTSRASLITAIMSSEPAPISTVQPMTPPALDRVVKTCLAKDPEDRWQSAGDIKRELKWIGEGSLGERAPAEPHRKPRRLLWLAAVVLAALSGAILARVLLRPEPSAAPVYRLSILPPEKTASYGTLALSPDGQRLAFTGVGPDGTTTLWIQPLDSLTARPLPGTENATDPFWSPDGRSLGFFAQRKLKRIDLAGGPPEVLCDASDPRGGTWSRDGVIVFAPNGGDGLYRISASGGALARVTRLDGSRREISHRWPHFLPDGRRFLYMNRIPSGPDRLTVEVASLDSKERTRLFAADSSAEYARGRLVFQRESTLLTQPFDPARLRLSGRPFPADEGVWSGVGSVDGLVGFSTSEMGLLAYRRGSRASDGRLTWFDRTGRDLGTLGSSGSEGFSLSPDGGRAILAVTAAGGEVSLWLTDVAGGKTSRLAVGSSPIWTHDGRRIIFASDRSGQYDLYEKAVDGVEKETLLYSSPYWKFAESCSPDGRSLLFRQDDPKTGIDLWVLPITGDRKPFPFLQTESDESLARFSGDGRWIAYVSNESGRDEVYVQSFPASPSGVKTQISVNGGSVPEWGPNQKEIFYLAADNRVMASDVTVADGRFQAGLPKPLFQARPLPTWRTPIGFAVTPQGDRFLMNTLVGNRPSSAVTLLINGMAEPSR